jgi:hypothetical protein
MAQLGPDQQTVRVRLSARDAASLKKLARNAQLSVSDVLRLLIRRERVSSAKLAKTLGDLIG